MNFQGFGGQYCVDVVMCIDATGSMQPIIEEVKENALSLYTQFVDGMERQNKTVGELRVKIVAFRDYICDAVPMAESPFFELPAQSRELQEYVSGIEALGGGDTPECAFEAIATAMNSEWTRNGKKRRHVVVVFTDAPALPMGERAGCPNYPMDLPATLADLNAWWEGASQLYSSNYQAKAGRLIAFVPNDDSWEQIAHWNRFTPSYTAGQGCSSVDMSTIIDTVVGSF